MKPIYSFVHIPKNAGTSIAKFFRASGLPILISEHDYECKLGTEEIVVLRCPIDRFISAFNYCKKYWPNPVIEEFSCASELAESALDPNHKKHVLASIEMGNKPSDKFQRDRKMVRPTPSKEEPQNLHGYTSLNQVG